jgi:hypothetical protein
MGFYLVAVVEIKKKYFLVFLIYFSHQTRRFTARPLMSPAFIHLLIVVHNLLQAQTCNKVL